MLLVVVWCGLFIVVFGLSLYVLCDVGSDVMLCGVLIGFMCNVFDGCIEYFNVIMDVVRFLVGSLLVIWINEEVGRDG